MGRKAQGCGIDLQLGHLNFESLISMISNEMVLGLPNISKLHHCETCILEKQVRRPFQSRRSGNALAPLQLIHTDICGPIQTSSLRGNKYYLLFVDDHSRKCWVYCFKQKSKAYETFVTFKQMVETQSGLKIKVLRTDRGVEFTSNDFNSFL